jgi:hypothetical protein
VGYQWAAVRVEQPDGVLSTRPGSTGSCSATHVTRRVQKANLMSVRVSPASLNLNSSCPRPQANPPPPYTSTLYTTPRMLPTSPYHRHLSVTLPMVQRTRASQEWAQEPFSRSAWPNLSALSLFLHVTTTDVPNQEPFLHFANG